MLDILSEAHARRQRGERFVLATVVRAEKPTSAKPGAKAIITEAGDLIGWIGGSCAQPTVRREARRVLGERRPQLLRLLPPSRFGGDAISGVREVALTCASGGVLEIYMEPCLPQATLVVVGHFEVSDCLARIGAAMGYRVVVMSPEIVSDQFDSAAAVHDHCDFSRLDLPADSFICVASHGNYDEAAIESALRHTSSQYVAVVASPRRAERLRADLLVAGLSEAELERVQSPAGLDIGAESPDEIALSIIAEIISLRRAPDGAAAEDGDLEPEDEARDPVCGMMVEVSSARYTSSFDGRRHYFCCSGCQRSFEKNPTQYLGSEQA